MQQRGSAGPGVSHEAKAYTGLASVDVWLDQYWGTCAKWDLFPPHQYMTDLDITFSKPLNTLFKWNAAGLIKIENGNGSEAPVVLLVSFHKRGSWTANAALWCQNCMILPAQGERVSSTSAPFFLFSSLVIIELLQISSRSAKWLVLLAEHSFRLFVSSCAAVTAPLEKMPMAVPVSTLTISYSCCNTVKIWDWAISGPTGLSSWCSFFLT